MILSSRTFNDIHKYFNISLILYIFYILYDVMFLRDNKKFKNDILFLVLHVSTEGELTQPELCPYSPIVNYSEFQFLEKIFR